MEHPKNIHPIVVPTNKFNLQSLNYYLVEEQDSLTLMDAGIDSDECWDHFIHALSDKGYTLNDLTRIILTHSHEDHTGIINRILSKRKLPIYAHVDAIPQLKRDKDFLLSRIEFFKQLYSEMNCGDSGVLQIEKMNNSLQNNAKKCIDADIIPITETDSIAGLQVIETPGHSPDHLVFFDREKKWLYSGDHLVNHISSNAIVEPNYDGNRRHTLIEYIESLQKCLKLDIDVVFSGHGPAITNPKELINLRLTRIQQKSNDILQLIKSGLSTGNQIAQAFYKDKYYSEFYLVMSEIIGHLDLLESTNKIQKEMKNGIIRYSSHAKKQVL